MPFCPKCESEYRPEFTKCADCGEYLVERLPEEAQDPVECGSSSCGCHHVSPCAGTEMSGDVEFTECSECGAAVDDTDVKCPACGEPFED